MLIVVVGPSGAGKDTLMSYAARRLAHCPDLTFVRRVITRDPNTGGEDFVSVSETEFVRLAQEGAFAVSWGAHGLNYGIPADVRGDLAAGKVAIVNGSREALPHFEQAFPRLTVITVTARPEVLAERLQARGRETREEILHRLERTTPEISGTFDLVTIDNSGELKAAGDAMVSALRVYLPASKD